MALLHVIPLYAGNVTAPSSSPVTAYTVPTGYRIVVHDITMHNLSSSAAVTVGIIINGAHLWNQALAAAASAEMTTWWVATQGATLQLYTSVSSGATIVVSGYIYTI